MQAAGFIWDFEVPPLVPDPAPSVPELLREVEALRVRLAQAPDWFNRPQDTLRAGALAEEVKRLCQESCRSDDQAEVAALLDGARKCLDELQILLGSH
jgi:uncharacterized protein YhaN